MEKGTPVFMILESGDISGITIENESTSPTQKEPDRKVIRVRWEDGSESIERVDALFEN